MPLIRSSAARVPANTAAPLNARIRRDIEARLGYFAAHPEGIADRLAELDREWDVERALETGSASLSLLGLTLGLTRGKRWLLLPLAVQSFFLQHALQGWCPPLPVFRRLGFRTAQEIEAERHALKTLRGDVDHVRERRDSSQKTFPLAQATDPA
jgi:hypothetical protein